MTEKHNQNVVERGNDLIDELITTPENFKNFSELLRLFNNGLPLSMLESLLGESDNKVVLGALFIVEELGTRANSLSRVVIENASSANSLVRASAYNALSRCITQGNEEQFICVAYGLCDSEPRCRKIAALLMMRAAQSWLDRAAQFVSQSTEVSEFCRGMNFLAVPAVATNDENIGAWLASEEPLMRRFGAVAAGRIATSHPDMLQLASRSDDLEIRDWASAQSRFISLRHRRQGLKK